MKELIEKMKVLQATAFAFYLKAHNFHWNIEGPNFVEYHSFLDGLYNDVWGSVDAIAEHTRTLESYVPGSFVRFKELSKIEDEVNIPTAMSMMIKLVDDNQKVIDALRDAEKEAGKVNAIGIQNFLQDRIDIHFKHAWMLKSITKVK
jgi:starvation-inducible DNA-binding protein